MVRGRIFACNINGFSSFPGNVFAVLVYYLEVGDVDTGMVVENAGFVNCTVDMIFVFFYYIFQTSVGFSYATKL